MAQKDQIEYWHKQMRLGLQHRKKYANSADWSKWTRYYAGAWAQITPRPKLPMNYMFAQFRAMVPQIYYRNPRVSVVPLRSGLEPNARVLQSVLNHLIQEMRVKAQLKAGILHAMLWGTGFIKQGYDSEYGTKPEMFLPPVMTAGGVADLSGESMTNYGADKRRIEYNADVQPGMPWALVVPPQDILVDPMACDVQLRDARWIAHRVLRRVSDVQADEKYDEAVRMKVQAGFSEEYVDPKSKEIMDAATEAGEDPNAAKPHGLHDSWVELYELRDVESGRIRVFTMSQQEYLRDDVDELQIDGLPFVPLIFNQNPECFWGISDAQVLHPQQEELNQVREMQRAYRRMAVSRYFMRKGTLSPKTMERWLSGELRAFIETEEEFDNKMLDDMLKEVQGYIPPDLGAWSDLVQQDMRDLSGMGRNQTGDFNRGAQGGASRASATEAQIVQQNSQIRMDERRDIVSDALTAIMRRAAQTVFRFWTAERVARVAGPNGAQHWVRYNGEQLRGEYDFRIDPDDALPVTRQKRQETALMLLQTVAPMLQPQQLIQLVKHTLDQFEEVDAEAVLNPPMPQGAPMSIGEYGAQMQAGAAQEGMNAGIPAPM